MSAIGPHTGVEAVILPNELVKIALSNSWVGFGFFCFLIAWAFIIVWCGSACKKDPASGVIGVQKGTTIPMV
jgi:hypothetical protein